MNPTFYCSVPRNVLEWGYLLEKPFGAMETVMDKRRGRRFLLTLPLTLTSGAEVARQPVQTRDVSSGGVYFEIGEAPQAGSRLEFVLTLPTEITLSAPVKVRCVGKVIRVDRSPGRRVGVAATIERYEFFRASTASEEGDLPVV